jgi:hypothetical protein
MESEGAADEAVMTKKDTKNPDQNDVKRLGTDKRKKHYTELCQQLLRSIVDRLFFYRK